MSGSNWNLTHQEDIQCHTNFSVYVVLLGTFKACQFTCLQGILLWQCDGIEYLDCCVDCCECPFLEFIPIPGLSSNA